MAQSDKTGSRAESRELLEEAENAEALKALEETRREPLAFEHAALHRALAASQDDVEAGRLFEADEVLRELRRS